MSILIKGMDMPKNCSTCPFYICDEEGWCVILREYISHYEYCPLVEVQCYTVAQFNESQCISHFNEWEKVYVGID